LIHSYILLTGYSTVFYLSISLIIRDLFIFREFEAKSGNWFYSKFPRSMRDRATNEIVSGGKIVRDAISSGSLVGQFFTYAFCLK